MVLDLQQRGRANKNSHRRASFRSDFGYDAVIVWRGQVDIHCEFKLETYTWPWSAHGSINIIRHNAALLVERLKGTLRFWEINSNSRLPSYYRLLSYYLRITAITVVSPRIPSNLRRLPSYYRACHHITAIHCGCRCSTSITVDLPGLPLSFRGSGRITAFFYCLHFPIQ